MDKIIAVDFDGTLCKDAWPGIGTANGHLIRHLKEYKRAGHKLILWTCRTGKQLEAAVNWCAKFDLTFDAINENVPEAIERFGGDCRKIYADVYFDDKAVRILVE